VFRGVPGQIAGLDLSTVSFTSTARLDDLTTVAQERVKQGIHADNQADAQQRLAGLTDDVPTNPNLKPLCTTPTTAPTTSATGAPSTPPSAGKTSTTAASNPAAQASDSVPPAVDPVGCRTAN
jgi:protein phosphatase